MKSWSASSALLALWAAPAWASPSEVLACLERNDVVCAQEAGALLGSGADARAAQAALAFHLGHFDDAARAMEDAQAAFAEPDQWREQRDLMVRTRDATAGFAVEKRGDVEIRYLPGLDAVLLDEAFQTLQAAHDRIGPRLGGAPPGGVRVEIYPEIERFIAASSLPAEAVRTTGVVALSKWTRVLATSPRTLARGYGWKDTLAHEYIHYLVAWRTQDRCPVWLQEGIARSHEALWRTSTFEPLPPRDQGLIARALAGDALVPFSKMNPSFALLPSADEAALAYAQVSTMVETLTAKAGEDAVSTVLDRVRDGVDALQAVADAASGGDPAAFMAAWKADLQARKLDARALAALPTVTAAGEDEFAIDPVLSQHRDLARRVRLGDLLLGQDRADAALVEYTQAVPADEPPSPIVSARLAKALLALGRSGEARTRLEASVRDYPDIALTRKMLGELDLSAGRRDAALEQYRASADVYPFDPDVQGRLADLYAARGEAEPAARHARYRRMIESGGFDPETR